MGSSLATRQARLVTQLASQASQAIKSMPRKHIHSYIARIVRFLNTFVLNSTFICGLLIVVLLSTILELIPGLKSTRLQFVKSLSLIENSKLLFLDTTNGSEERFKVLLDIIRVLLVVAGTLAHIVTCVEMPNSYFMIGDCISRQCSMDFLTSVH